MRVVTSWNPPPVSLLQPSFARFRKFGEGGGAETVAGEPIGAGGGGFPVFCDAPRAALFVMDFQGLNVICGAIHNGRPISGLFVSHAWQRRTRLEELTRSLRHTRGRGRRLPDISTVDPGWRKSGSERWTWSFLPTVYSKAAFTSFADGAPAQDGAYLQVDNLSFRPPGTELNLLDKVNMSLSEKSLGLVYGPSGSGKTTLLQVLGGLATPSEGSIYLRTDGKDAAQRPLGPVSLSARVGIVFQFPERYFLTDTIVEELVFGFPRQTEDQLLRHTMTMRLQAAIVAVGLSGMPLDMNPRALSDGYKRRLALAIQLVRLPDVMLLDEPLAGLDWKARADVVRLLSALKNEKTLIVVSHDLRELTGIADRSWQMGMGGRLMEQSLP